MAVLAGALAAAAVLLWWRPPDPAWTPARAGPPPSRQHRGRDRASRAGEGGAVVAEAMELLALALHGGVSLGEATTQVATVLPSSRREQLGRVGRALVAGVDVEEAWAEAGPDWVSARAALELAAIAGVAPAQTLRQAALDLRGDLVSDVELATARLGVRLVLPLGLTFLPAFVLISVLPLVLALTRELAW